MLYSFSFKYRHPLLSSSSLQVSRAHYGPFLTTPDFTFISKTQHCSKARGRGRVNWQTIGQGHGHARGPAGGVCDSASWGFPGIREASVHNQRPPAWCSQYQPDGDGHEAPPRKGAGLCPFPRGPSSATVWGWKSWAVPISPLSGAVRVLSEEGYCGDHTP